MIAFKLKLTAFALIVAASLRAQAPPATAWDKRGNGPPTSGCVSGQDVGKRWSQINAEAENATLWVCSNTALGVYEWESVGSGGGGGGDVTGPGSSTTGHLATFADNTGKVIGDGGQGLPTGSIVGTGQSNTFSTGTQSFAAVTAFILPYSAAYAPTATGSIGQDSTSGRLKFGFGGASKTVAETGSALTSGNCVQANASGNLVSTGSPCSAGAAGTNDMRVTLTSTSVMTIGDTCSSLNPCNVRFDNQTIQFTASMTATIASGSGSGVAQVYITSAGVPLVDLPSGAGLTVNCSVGCSTQSSVTPAVPTNAIPLASVQITSGTWASANDLRALLSNHPIVPGTGISTSETAGVTTISIDTADVPQLGASNVWTGQQDFTAVPTAIFTNMRITPSTPSSSSATCTQGQTTADSSYIYYCVSTNTWKRATLNSF